MKFHVTTLGCKVNTYESEAITQDLIHAGYQPTEVMDEASIHIINTCAVTHTSDAKSRQMIRKAAKSNPHSTVCVIGCYSQLDVKTVQAIPGVDVVIGTSQRDHLLDYIREHQATNQQVIHVENIFKNSRFDPLEVTSYSDNTRAFLKIQDGCNNYCTFCIIPVTRGPIRSRPAEEVMKEAQRLVEAGFKEIVLTGIHTAGYGEDLDHYSFSQLIEDLVKTVPQLPRLRISSIEASQISEHLMDVMKDSRIVVDHLHMPIQSGSDTILKAMRRKYGTEFFRERVRLLRERFPEMAITTDVIVGFPGEGEREFQETVDFIREIQFSALHVFPYSIRRGTLAASMKNQVSAETKKARVDTLLDLSTLLEQRYAKKMLGKTLKLLVENYHKETGYVHGYTTNYIKVHVPGRPEMVNTIIPVRITEVTRDVIKGEIA